MFPTDTIYWEGSQFIVRVYFAQNGVRGVGQRLSRLETRISRLGAVGEGAGTTAGERNSSLINVTLYLYKITIFYQA